jgi:hypothetical protein
MVDAVFGNCSPFDTRERSRSLQFRHLFHHWLRFDSFRRRGRTFLRAHEFGQLFQANQEPERTAFTGGSASRRFFSPLSSWRYQIRWNCRRIQTTKPRHGKPTEARRLRPWFIAAYIAFLQMQYFDAFPLTAETIVLLLIAMKRNSGPIPATDRRANQVCARRGPPEPKTVG